MTTTAELAAALAFVLQKWKDTGAAETDTKPFDELLARAKEEPQVLPPMPTTPAPVERRDEPRRKPQRLPMSEKLRALDAEIDAVNREADGE